MQWYAKEYCELQCIHSHIGTEASGYQNDQWYIHTNNMKKCAIIGCGKPSQVCNVVKKWTEDKQNIGVVGWANNQMTIIGLV